MPASFAGLVTRTNENSVPSDHTSMLILRLQCSVTTSIVADPRLESPRRMRSTLSMMSCGNSC